MQHLDTLRLLDQAQCGSASAIECLLNRYRNRLCQIVTIWLDYRLSARFDPADIVQEAQLNAAMRLPKYLADRPVAFFPWLKSLVLDELIRVHRHHLHTQKRSVNRANCQQADGTGKTTRGGNALVSQDPSPSQHAIAHEQQALVRQILNRLSISHREILLMRCARQMSIREIADAMQISQEAVKSRVRRAYLRAARLLPKSLA